MRLVHLLLVPLFWMNAPLFADDPAYEANAKRGIDQVYNLEFEAAERTFAELIRQQPGNPAGHFFLAMVDWWRIMIDIDDESRDRKFLADLDRVIEMCDSILDHNSRAVDAMFFKGGSLGFQGRLRFHRSDYLGAANAGRKALPLVEEAFSLDPTNYDIMLGTGIYNYYAEVIPDEYPWVKPLLLFIPAGDRKKGLAELATVAEKGRYAGTESAYFLMQINYFYERSYGEVLRLARILNTRYPQNMVFHRYLGRGYVSLGNWAMAESVFTEIARRTRNGARGYTDVIGREAEFYLGTTLMNTGHLEQALSHFYRCDEMCRTLDRSEASGFMAMANLKIGNIFDLQGKRDVAVRQYNKVLAITEFKDSHIQARRCLETPYSTLLPKP